MVLPGRVVLAVVHCSTVLAESTEQEMSNTLSELTKSEKLLWNNKRQSNSSDELTTSIPIVTVSQNSAHVA